MAGLKVKHLALLPIIGILQIALLMYYVEQSDSELDHHEKHFWKHYAAPVRWQWSNGQLTNDEYRVHRNFRNFGFIKLCLNFDISRVSFNQSMQTQSDFLPFVSRYMLSN